MTLISKATTQPAQTNKNKFHNNLTRGQSNLTKGSIAIPILVFGSTLHLSVFFWTPEMELGHIL